MNRVSVPLPDCFHEACQPISVLLFHLLASCSLQYPVSMAASSVFLLSSERGFCIGVLSGDCSLCCMECHLLGEEMGVGSWGVGGGGCGMILIQ